MKKLIILTVLLTSVFSTNAYSRDYHNDNYDSWDVVYDSDGRRADRRDRGRDHHRRGRECRNDRQIINTAYDFDRAVDYFMDTVRRVRRGNRLFGMARDLAFEAGKFHRMAERRLPCRALRSRFHNLERAFHDLENQISHRGRGFHRGNGRRGPIRREFNELRRDFRRLQNAVEGGRHHPAPRPRY